MKKIYFILLLITCSITNAQIITIPDANFKSLLIDYCDDNNDGEIEVNEALTLEFMYIQGTIINSLEGIEYFLNLTDLYVIGLQITSLDLSTLSNLENLTVEYNSNLSTMNLAGLSSLINLECSNNGLTSLDFTGLENVESINCSSNELTYITMPQLLNLTTLFCSSNSLTELDISGLPNLSRFVCSSNLLTTLNTTNCINMREFYCTSNNLIEVDLSQMNQLELFVGYNNEFSSLNFGGLSSLTSVYCDNNFLTNLNVVGCGALTLLSCYNNQLSSVNLEGCENIQYYTCMFNNISGELDLSSLSNLTGLYCGDNPLSSINIQNGSIESTLNFSNIPNLTHICADEDQLETVQTKVNEYEYFNCTVDASCSLGINDLKANELVLSPNPATNVLNIASKEEITLTSIAIYNTLGQLVIAVPNAQNVSTIDVSNLTTGNYFIKVVSDSGISTAKFIKQ